MKCAGVTLISALIQTFTALSSRDLFPLEIWSWNSPGDPAGPGCNNRSGSVLEILIWVELELTGLKEAHVENTEHISICAMNKHIIKVQHRTKLSLYLELTWFVQVCFANNYGSWQLFSELFFFLMVCLKFENVFYSQFKRKCLQDVHWKKMKTCLLWRLSQSDSQGSATSWNLFLICDWMVAAGWTSGQSFFLTLCVHVC